MFLRQTGAEEQRVLGVAEVTLEMSDEVADGKLRADMECAGVCLRAFA